MSVILLLVLLLHWMQSGSVIGGSEQGAQGGADQEGHMGVHTGGHLGGEEEGVAAGHYEDAETCPCTSYTSNMRTVVVKNTWYIVLMSKI